MVWGDPPGGETSAGIPWSRYLAALARHKWLMLAIVIAGTTLGVLATRLLKPVYEVQGTIWISQAERPQREVRGPIRAEELVNPTAWIELFKSFAVVDAVVRNMSLYLALENWGDSLVFAGFTIEDGFTPGHYTLTVDPPSRTYVLASDETEIERGTIGGPIGRRVGFWWSPTVETLGERRAIEFSVVNPRDVSVQLRDRVTTVLPERSNFLRVTLTGADPARTTAILNTWINEFVATAADLKKRNLVDLATVLGNQLNIAKEGLTRAENAFESYRTRTITLPSEGARGGGGAEPARDPVMDNFFRQRISRDDIRQDRQALERTMADLARGTVSPDALLSVPSVRNDADNLTAAITELGTQQKALREAQRLFTDEHVRVRELRQSVDTLEQHTIPRLAAGVLEQLRRREQDLNGRVQQASQDLRTIPNRTIEEMRLRRDVDVADNLYTTLQNRYEEARLAEASAVPDVSILDRAVAPQWPAKDRAPLLVLTAFAVSLAVAAGVALLRDRVDRRFRYPEQAAHELGLDIIGAVPPIRAALGEADPVEAAQVVEAFRSIRIHVQQAYDAAGPVLLTISSPGVGDGKSLVSSKLALSFADAGIRTLLIDGDIRRGQQHSKFGIPPRPGLLDYLAGDASMKEVIHSAPQTNLSVIPHGTKRERGPELLASEGMSHLVATLASGYEAIIIDSPPLGANIDPFALGSITGNMLLVLRTGETDRKVAEAKLKSLERFPIRLLGAVLNDFDLKGPYQQYSYLYGYGTLDEEWNSTVDHDRPADARPVESLPPAAR